MYDLYESIDSGVTWHRKNLQSFLLRTKRDWQHNANAFYYADTFVMNNWNAVYRSTNAGITWDTIPGPGVWDMVSTPSGLLVSTTFDGIQLSTDTCKTWHSTSGTRAFPGSAKMEVAVATKDVSYAVLLDNDHLDYSHAEFLRSSNGGDSWDVLFTSKWLEHVAVRYHEETRYFVVADTNTILSGTVNQVTPDTVLIASGPITELLVGEVYPYELVAKVGDGGGFTYYLSTDAGATWVRHALPVINLQQFRILPSSLTSGTYTAVVDPENSSNYIGMGIWHVSDYGRRWVMKYEDSGLRTTTFALCANDELYWHDEKQFSSDHGKTWYDNFKGLTEDEKALLLSLLSHTSFKAIKNALLSGDANHWLWYKDGSWRRLLDRIGNPLSRSIPASFDFVDDVLYAVYPKHGAYRTEVSNLATGAAPLTAPSTASLVCYPNPVTDRAAFSYTTSHAGPARLQLVNTLGAVLYERQLDRAAGEVVVDFAREVAGAASSGVLLSRILAGDRVVVSRVFLVMR